MKQRCAPWAYGLPKKTTIFDNNNSKIAETEYIYDWSSYLKQLISGASCNCVTERQESIKDTEYFISPTYTTTSSSHLKTELYYFYTGRVNLVSTKEKKFNQSDNTKFATTIVQYQYNPNNYLPNEIITTKSNGDKIIKDVYYSIDYSVPGVLQSMTNQNMVNTIIASYNSILKVGSNTKIYLGAEIDEYKFIGSDIKVDKHYSGRVVEPITNFSFNTSNPLNFPNLFEVRENVYDGSGNLVGLKGEGERFETNIFDFDNRYVIASVVNANPSEDKPCYTSFESDEFGGWIVPNNSGTYWNDESVTGKRTFGLLGSMEAFVNPAKSYRLSLWATNPENLVINNATLVTSSPVINGFTYCEYDFPAGLTSIGIFSINSNIDEVRLYPKNARMRTVTYDPLIGKTSECDENNRIIKYEYDNLGRLRFIKDEKGNVVKMYEYNVKQ